MTSTAHEPRSSAVQKTVRGHAVKHTVKHNGVECTTKPESDLKIKLDYVVRAPTPLGQRPVSPPGRKKK